MAGPLAGMKVLDLSRLVPGAYCSLLLGDLGAEILKIEDCETGDTLRHWGPRLGGQSAFFAMLNRNKKSMKLNLKTNKGKKVFLQLARQHDVVLEGFRPGVMERLDLGYETLRKVNPGLIYCAITGYGYTGPYRDRAGHDLNYLSLAGVMSTIACENGAPVIPGIQIADVGGGAMLAAIAILAAYISRQKSGEGQFIDISMLDGAFAWLALAVGKLVADEKGPKTGDTFLTGRYACYHIYETRDGRYMGIGALEPKFWEAFCRAVKRDDLIAYQFAEDEKQAYLISEISQIFKGRTRDEWVAFFSDKDCCCEAVNSVAEAVNDTQLQARGMIVKSDHPSGGVFEQIGIPAKFSETPGAIRLLPPNHGEHTIEILKELGYRHEQIQNLEEEGVI